MTPEFEGLSLVQMIDLLEPAPQPPPVSMAPETIGWALLAAVLLAALIWGCLQWRAWHRANAYRRAALVELEAHSDNPAIIAQILRRTALVAYPREQIAPMTGDTWLRFLDESYGGSGFSDGPGQIVAEAPYRPCPPNPALAPLARAWITQHRRPL